MSWWLPPVPASFSIDLAHSSFPLGAMLTIPSDLSRRHRQAAHLSHGQRGAASRAGRRGGHYESVAIAREAITKSVVIEINA